MDSLIDTTVILLAAASALGFVAALIGRRGRTVDRHPVCRRCRFDLVGARSGAKCPECGTDLSRPRAIRFGNRQRRGWLMIVGGLASLAAGVTGAIIVYSRAQNVNWQAVKPVWLLLREARSTSDFTSSEACSELTNRVYDRRWSGDGLEALLQDFVGERSKLGTRADLGIRLEAWQHLLGAAGREGLLGPEAACRLLDDSLVITSRTRSVVPSGSVQPLFWDVPTVSVCGWGDMKHGLYSYGFTCRLESITVGSRVLSISDDDWTSSVPVDRESGKARITIDLPPGPHDLVATWVVDIYLPTKIESPAGTLRRSRVFPITVVDTAVPVVTIETDELLRSQIEAAAKIQVGQVVPSDGGDQVTLCIDLPGLPVPLEGRVSIRWVAGSLADVGATQSWRQDDNTWYSRATIRRVVRATLPDSIDVVITPDPEHAAAESTATAIWGHEVIVRDVMLKRQ